MSEDIRKLIKNKDNKTLKSMISKVDYAYHESLVSYNGEHMLFWAVVENNLEFLEYLLKNKLIHVNLSNYRSTAPLTYACIEGNLEAIKILIKYNANPSRRSGYSGFLPKQQTEDPKIINILKEYEDKYIPLKYYIYDINNPGVAAKLPEKKDNFTHYQVCKYRIYMYHCAILEHYYVPECYPHLRGNIEKEKEIIDLYKSEGIVGLSNLCDKSLEKFINSVDKIDKNKNYCLNCDSTEKLRRCTKCKKAYFCNRECQKKVFKFHSHYCK